MIGIYVNITRDIGAKNAKIFIQRLVDNGVEYCVLGGIDGEIQDISKVYDKLEMVVVFGGDGTILSVFKMLQIYSIPIIGVNAGNLGFLTAVATDELDKLVDAIISKNYTIETRSVLKVCHNKNIYYAINDCSLSRGNSTHTIKVSLNIDGKYADSISGDGMMISTPTGSTAYSLSCGGPILSPDVDAFVVIGICPHTLHSRPMVISGRSTVEFVADNTEGTLVLTVDGDSILLPPSQSVKITIVKADKTIRFIRISEDNFYNRLIKKLNYWNDNGR